MDVIGVGAVTKPGEISPEMLNEALKLGEIVYSDTDTIFLVQKLPHQLTK